MDKCSVCECDLPKERIHLGYKECLKCSDTEKYASHVVYPHKTGGYIQPMSSEQADNMKRLDRRSVGGERKAKGIVADKSWDRWLKNYYNPKPKKKKYTPPPAPTTKKFKTPGLCAVVPVGISRAPVFPLRSMLSVDNLVNAILYYYVVETTSIPFVCVTGGGLLAPKSRVVPDTVYEFFC